MAKLGYIPGYEKQPQWLTIGKAWKKANGLSILIGNQVLENSQDKSSKRVETIGEIKLVPGDALFLSPNDKSGFVATQDKPTDNRPDYTVKLVIKDGDDVSNVEAKTEVNA